MHSESSSAYTRMFNFNINKWRKVLIFVIIIAFLLVTCQLLQGDNGKHHWKTDSNDNVPLIIWWTPLIDGGYESRRLCETNFCRFTTKRDQMDEASVSHVKELHCTIWWILKFIDSLFFQNVDVLYMSVVSSFRKETIIKPKGINGNFCLIPRP